MKTWAEYYDSCRKEFNNTEKPDVSIYDLRLQMIPDSILDEEYYRIVSNISKDVTNNMLEQGTVQQINALSVKSVSPFMDDFQLLCDKYFKKYLEDNVFGSYVYCDNIKIYQTPKDSNKNKSSWIWHLDNNPKEQVKIMVYLSNVTAGYGAFEYIKDTDNEAVKATTRRVDHKDWCTSKGEHQSRHCSWWGSRVPDEAILAMVKSGCKPTPIHGKMGTAILFDNNIVHKGSLPTKGDRLAATLQFRPINYNRDSLVDKSYTGDGWAHTTFNMDPSIDTNIVRR
tara:strand:+ start:1947 stop:2795 length:849 start_codon:yes stop_codon:yes gene_type:complete